jgi:UDP-N-acetylglucosamine 2-epimerase (non-hydrolysing)
MVATDSWWIQEEACILEKKTLILRNNTERPETLDVWWAILVWNNKDKIINGYNELINKNIKWYNPFWNWKTYKKIFDLIN